VTVAANPALRKTGDEKAEKKMIALKKRANIASVKNNILSLVGFTTKL
jgi:hypothetical protein